MFVVYLFFVAPQHGKAERLPIKNYSSADGLASSAITHIARDSQGFLWFSSRDGLSRFDGVEFVNYRLPNLPASQTFRYFLETRDGALWFAADDGLYRARRGDRAEIKPAAPDSFSRSEKILNAQKVAANGFGKLFEDSRGRLWGGSGSLFLLENRDAETVAPRELPTNFPGRKVFTDIVEADDGSIWALFLTGALRILPDERQIFYTIPRESEGDEAFGIEVDRQGRIWIGQRGGAFVFKPENVEELRAATNNSIRALKPEEIVLETASRLDLPDDFGRLLKIAPARDERAANSDLPTNSAASAIFRATDGKLWIVFGKSLYAFENENYRRVGDENALPGTTRSIVEDADKNLWLGTNGGAVALVREGLTTYGESENLPEPQINAIYENSNGELLVAHGIWRVSRFTGERFESAILNLPSDSRFTWTSSVFLPDADGGLWALERNNLYRFPPAEIFSALARQTPQNVLRGAALYRAFLDRRSDVWFATRGLEGQNGLLKYSRVTGEFQDMSLLEGYPRGKSPASFAEDAHGNIWFGFYGADGLLKFSGNRFREFTPDADGLPRGGALALHVDRKNRLWIGSTLEGLTRVDDASAEKLQFARYTTNEGLASNNIRTIIEDLNGNIYVGTVRGVDRIAPESGRVRHFSTADGLAADFINAAFTDKNGALWFGTPNGLSRLVPQEEIAPSAPQIFINSLEIAGENYSISEFGQQTAAKLNLSAAQNNLQIGFASVGADVKYQYKLEEANEAEWSKPSAQRSVNFANLAPGEYRFSVRAVSGNGAASENPAIVSFTINPPFYQSRWFVALAAILIAALIFALDRYRVSKTRQVEAALEELRRSKEERLRELERVRARIATDLHDDIGSSLTQIAVLSQAAQNRLAAENGKLAAPLERISTVSVELVNAMSDIVWAINPRKDNVRDLVQRMRRFAADVFTAKGMKFDFDAPDVESRLQLGANIRREVFAIYKEAVNNVVRHSGGTRAEIALKLLGDVLTLQIADDGRGFDSQELLHQSQPPMGAGGNGLQNMQKRGAELGGRCEIISFPGGGTTILLEIPIHFEAPENRTSQTAGENGAGNRLK